MTITSQEHRKRQGLWEVELDANGLNRVIGPDGFVLNVAAPRWVTDALAAEALRRARVAERSES